MSFLICFILTALLSVALRKPIHKVPWVFYIVCVLLNVLLISMRVVTLPQEIMPALSFLMQRANLSMALFTVVMFIGVLPRSGNLSHWLRPIRAELSIMASILIVGHMILYLMTYIPRFMSGLMVKTNVYVSFAVAIALLVLVLLLGITSFRFVKRHMKARTWKKIQNLSYIFYALVFLHLMLMFAPGFMAGQQLAVTQVVVYCVVFAAYVVLRVWRAIVDKREKVDLVETVADQGFTA